MMSTESLFYCDSYVCLDIWSKFILSIIYKFQWYKQKITNVFQLKLISEKMQKKPTKKQVLFISIFFFFYHWQKYEGYMQPESKKFSLDPQITSFEMLQHIIASAFSIKGFVLLPL